MWERDNLVIESPLLLGVQSNNWTLLYNLSLTHYLNYHHNSSRWDFNVKCWDTGPLFYQVAHYSGGWPWSPPNPGNLGIPTRPTKNVSDFTWKKTSCGSENKFWLGPGNIKLCYTVATAKFGLFSKWVQFIYIYIYI